MKGLGGHYACAASALLCLAALPPWGLWPLALLCWVPAMHWCAGRTTAVSLLAGGSSGLVIGLTAYLGAAVIDVTTWVVASLAVAGLVGVFLAIVSGLLLRPVWYSPLLAGATWATLEQGVMAAGVPFSLALTLSDVPLLQQSAAIGGQWTVSALLISLQCSVAIWLSRRDTAATLTGVGWLTVATLMTAVGHQHSPPGVDVIDVAVVQTRLHPLAYVRTEADGRLRALAAGRDELARAAMDTQPDLIVWPEVPFARFEARHPAPRWPQVTSAQLIAGNDLGNNGRQYNAVFGIDTSGRVRSRHAKTQLLPRLENKYAAGADWSPHRQLPGAPGSLICFESAFGEVARRLSLNGAGVLTIATSDAFAGPSTLPWLHAAFAPLRAIETRRAVARSANGGPSFLLDSHGRTLASLDVFSRGIVSAPLPVITAPSVYARHADTVRTLWGLLMITGLCVVLISRRSHAAPTVRSTATFDGRALITVQLGALTLAAGVACVTGCVVFAHSQQGTLSWPGAGYVANRDADFSFRDVSAETEREDEDAAVALVLRRFGEPATTRTVAADRATLARTSVYAIDAKILLESRGFLVQPMTPDAQASSLPCVATLDDRTTVVITRRALDAIEVFLPAQGQHVTLPGNWLASRLAGPAYCVPGRAYAWDIPGAP